MRGYLVLWARTGATCAAAAILCLGISTTAHAQRTIGTTLGARQQVVTKTSVRPLAYTGVNLAGGEFFSPKPGVTAIYGQNFVYPSNEELDYFAGKGMNTIRFPIRWEILQPSMKAPLVTAELDRVKAVVTAATGKGLVVILDPHNYARYYDKLVGSPDVPNEALADLWAQMAAAFKDNPRVWFGLMNEPHDIPTDQWLSAANAAIAAIRKTGAKNTILVPGNGWDSAAIWKDSGNETALLQLKDPANRLLIEVHSYFDSDSSGSHPDIKSPTVGVDRLREVTDWCRQNHLHALLGEFGAPSGEEAATAVDTMLTYMEQNRDVWSGFTWWAAGAWWGDYMFSLEPKDGKDKPQIDYLAPHLQKKTVRPTVNGGSAGV